MAWGRSDALTEEEEEEEEDDDDSMIGLISFPSDASKPEGRRNRIRRLRLPALDPRRIVVDGAGGNFFCLRVYRRQEECKKANNYTQRAERRRSWIDPSIQFPRKVT